MCLDAGLYLEIVEVKSVLSSRWLTSKDDV